MTSTEIKFKSLDEVEIHVLKLQRSGYVATGNWNLSQICEHLSDWMSYPMLGFPKSGPIIGAILFCIRTIAGRKLFKDVVSKQKMKAGQPTLPQSIHSPNLDEEASVKRLINTIHELQDFQGTLYPSPLFGKLTHDECISLHIAHCAHHLSFLKGNDD